LGWRILQQAQALIQQGTREAYAKAEADEPILTEVLRQDQDLATVHDRAASRYHIRDVLFDRYGYNSVRRADRPALRSHQTVS
jgi:hypothetical protein